MNKLIDEPQYKFLSCALFAVINAILITALTMCVFGSLTVHAEENNNIYVTDLSVSDSTYYYKMQFTADIDLYKPCIYKDGINVFLGYYDISKDCIAFNTQNGWKLVDYGGGLFSGDYIGKYITTLWYKNPTSFNVPYFTSKETALSYFQTGDTSGQLNKPEEINPTSGSILVTANVESTYNITLPATLALSYNESSEKYEGEYTVGVQANLINGEAVKVIPNSTVSMTNERGDSVDGIVSQTINTWKLTASAENEIVSDYTQYINATGKVSADLTKAGNYSGNLNFTFTKTSD